MSESKSTARELLALTAQIVAAYVGNSPVAADALSALIRSVHDSLATAGTPAPEPAAPQEPAVPIKRSVHHEYLVCLEDGVKMKMLKRYIAKRFGLTPAQYRTKWGLPADYPMVAPAYAERRSALARDIGLGRKPKTAAAELAEADIAGAEAALGKSGGAGASKPKRGPKTAV